MDFETSKTVVEEHFGVFFLGFAEGFAEDNDPDEGNDPDQIVIVMADAEGVTLCAPSWLLGESKRRAREFINRPRPIRQLK